MSSATSTKAWIVAASIGAVEALKDQGICRWNYPIRLLQQNVSNKIRSSIQSKIMAPSSSASSTTASAAAPDETRKANMRKRENALEKTMSLSCWGPTTTRF